MIHGAVATIGETLLPFEFSIAAGASPRHDPGSKGRLFTHELIVIAEVPYEVERFIIGWGVPQLPVHFVILVLEDEFRRQGCLGSGLCWLLGQEIFQDLSLLLSNHHCRYSYASASAVIWHDDLINIFEGVIDDDSQATPCALYVSHLGNESAMSTIDQKYGRQDAIWVPCEVIGEVGPRTAISVCRVVIVSPYLHRWWNMWGRIAYHGLAIGDVSKVRERGRYLEIYDIMSKSLSLPAYSNLSLSSWGP